MVIIGGGFGGATCAKYIRQMDRSISVTLVEKEPRFITCPFSNLVLGGLRTMNSITQSFDALRKKHGVTVAQDEVVGIDLAAKQVKLKSGKTLAYDRLVVSPGISLKYDGCRVTVRRRPSGCRTLGRPGRKQCCCASSSRR